MADAARVAIPSPEAGEGRVGATADQLDTMCGGENNPHPNPPPAWGRGKFIALPHMRLPCKPGEGILGARSSYAIAPLRKGEVSDRARQRAT